jgi:hypothetical protein
VTRLLDLINKAELDIQAAVPISLSQFAPDNTGVKDSSTALDKAISAAKSSAGPGGVVEVPPGLFKVSLPVANAAAGQGITLRGKGRQVSTLVAPDANSDILTFGRTGAEVGDNFVIEDLGFSGGRYQLRSNNCLHMQTRRLWFSGGVSAGYFEGQNEGHRHEFWFANGQSGNAIDIGNPNGSAGVALDNPEMQKCSWSDVYIQYCGGLYAFNHSAGVLGANQQLSGYTSIRNLKIIGHTHHGLRLAHTQFVTLENYATEGLAKAAANTYQDLIFEAAGEISCNGLFLAVDGGQPVVQYYVYVNGSGPILITNLATGFQAAGTNDVFSASGILTLEEALLMGGSATGLGFSGTGAANFTGINVRNSSGVPIYGTGGQSANANGIANGGTIAVDQRVSRVTVTQGTNTTGIILAPGTSAGQQVTVENENASWSITFNVQATSNVQGGASVIINPLASRTFTWVTGLGLWV